MKLKIFSVKSGNGQAQFDVLEAILNDWLTENPSIIIEHTDNLSQPNMSWSHLSLAVRYAENSRKASHRFRSGLGGSGSDGYVPLCLDRCPTDCLGDAGSGGVERAIINIPEHLRRDSVESGAHFCLWPK